MRTSTKVGTSLRRSPVESEPVLRDERCPRCHGFMVDDWLLDMAQGGCLWGTGRRCVNCGHIAPTGTREALRPRRRPAHDEPDWHAAA